MFTMRLRLQNRSGGCVISHPDASQQLQVPSIRLPEQGVSVQGTIPWSKRSPSGVHTYCNRLSSSSGISVISWLVHQETLLNHQSVLLKMLELVGLKLNVKKSQLTPVHKI